MADDGAQVSHGAYAFISTQAHCKLALLALYKSVRQLLCRIKHLKIIVACRAGDKPIFSSISHAYPLAVDGFCGESSSSIHLLLR